MKIEMETETEQSLRQRRNALISLPPGGRWRAKRDGRSLRYKRQSKIKFIITPAPSPDFVGSSLPEGAYF